MRCFHPTRIIIHHSLTRDSGTVSWGAIMDYHTNTKGWQDIGYHAGVELARDRYHAFFGRPTTIPGAHCKPRNPDSLGICFVGNYDERSPDAEMLNMAVRRVLVPWCVQFNLGPQHLEPHSLWAGHKTCPGARFSMPALRHLLMVALANPRT